MTWDQWLEIKDILDDIGIQYELSLAMVINGVTLYTIKLPQIEYNPMED